MIDFDTYEMDLFRAFNGANGAKIGVKKDDVRYVLKIESRPHIKPEKGYTNSCFSEHVACRILDSIGAPVQKTELGHITLKSGKRSLAVACLDFTDNHTHFVDFASIKNTITDGRSNGYGTELVDIEDTLAEQLFVDPVEVTTFFWNMFIYDALIGNFDRHNGNWGFLLNETMRTQAIAPIFDCGSSLYPQLQIDEYKNILCNAEEILNRIYVFPNSAIKEDGKKINYHNFLTSLKNKNCNDAVIRVVPKIDMDTIFNTIHNMDDLSEIQKEFYFTMLDSRKRLILDAALEKLWKGA